VRATALKRWYVKTFRWNALWEQHLIRTRRKCLERLPSLKLGRTPQACLAAAVESFGLRQAADQESLTRNTILPDAVPIT
jgi:hypothetical protein